MSSTRVMACSTAPGRNGLSACALSAWACSTAAARPAGTASCASATDGTSSSAATSDLMGDMGCSCATRRVAAIRRYAPGPTGTMRIRHGTRACRACRKRISGGRGQPVGCDETRGVSVTVPPTALPIAMFVVMLAAPSAQRGPATAPAGAEDFDVKVSVTAKPPAVGTVVVPLTVHLDRYTPEHARTLMTDGLKHGGYPGFV